MGLTATKRLSAALALACGLAACNGSDRSNTSGGSTNPNPSGGTEPDPIGLLISGTLNDTGVQSCTDGGEEPQVQCPQAGLPGQDGQLGRDAMAQHGELTKQGAGVAGFDWSKLDAGGNRLSVQNAAWEAEGTEAGGTRWSCVQDHVTGLFWEVKESAPDHPRYGGHSYVWYLDTSEQHGGSAGHVDGGSCTTPPCNTASYVDWVNTDELCGFRDWRMPTVAELASIAVMNKVLPAMDGNFFPNVPLPRFFTSQSVARDPDLAWYVYFSDGSVSFTNKFDPSHVRLVRGEQW